MSRTYEEYCHVCQSVSARSDGLMSGRKLFQCTKCGACWVETTTIQMLKIVGVTEKEWKKAMEEAYNLIDIKISSSSPQKCAIEGCVDNVFDDCCYGMCVVHCANKIHHYDKKYPNIRLKKGDA